MAIFAAVLAAGAGVRLLGLFSHSTIPDEAFTFYVASHPWSQMLSMLRNGDFHPPLIYAAAHLLLALSGQAYLFRLLPAAFGVAGTAAAFFVSRRFMDAPWALLAMLIVALCPILVFYDGFFRMYALLWSLSLISWLALFRSFEAPAKPLRWIAYALIAAALMYTHYLAFFTIAAQAAYWLACKRTEWRFAAAFGAAIVLWLPWLPAFLTQFPNGGTAYAGAALAPQSLAVLPAALLTDSLPPSIEYGPWLGTFLWACVVGGIVWCAMRRDFRPLWLLLPLVLQALYGLLTGKNLIAQRYLLQLVPTFAILVAACAAALGARRLYLLAAGVGFLLVALEAVGVADLKLLPEYQPVDWNAYRTFLSQRVRPGDAVVFDQQAAFFTQAGAPYLNGTQVIPIRDQAQARQVAAQAGSLGRVWYVDYQSRLPDPQHAVFRGLLATHPKTTTWETQAAGFGDKVVTTLFER